MKEFLLKYPYNYRKFKEREVFQKVKVESPPFAFRADGVKFGKYKSLFKQPRDERIHRALVESAKMLIKTYSCEYAYISSDEVSLFCKSIPYGGRVEKIVSVFSSMLSALFSSKISPPGWFDGRVLLIAESEWWEYVAWRMKVCLCNYASQLTNKPCREALKEVRPESIAFGTLIVREEVLKEAVDKLSGERVTVVRRRLKELTGEELLDFLERKIKG